jgi:hypothetical protein
VSKRLAYLLSSVAVVIMLVGLVGCNRTPAGQPGAVNDGESEAQRDELLKAMLQYQKETGESLQTLKEEIQRRQSLEADKAGDPPVVRDLGVTRYALSEAQKAAQAKNAEAMGTALGRLKRVLAALAAELPAAVIIQHADRAQYYVQTQQAVGSREFVNASLALLSASDAALKGRPASLVPEVLKDIEAAKSAADKGSAEDALRALGDVITKASGHPSLAQVRRMAAAVRGAEEALFRQAWPVIGAELTELEERLDELSKGLMPAAEAVTATTTAPASANGQPAATTPAPTTATPAAPATPTTPVAPAAPAAPAPATSATPAAPAAPAPVAPPSPATR